MALYKLEDDSATGRGRLVGARPSNIDLESRLEDWLEASPGVLTESPCLWIGRQTTAPVDSGRTIYSDLLGLDSDGNLVIVELKRDRAPRDILAQCLDYASWVAELSDEAIMKIASNYWRDIGRDGSFEEIVADYFELESGVEFKLNASQSLILVAESFPESVTRVARYLRTRHGMDISIVAFRAFETGNGEVLIETESLVGTESAFLQTNSVARQDSGSRWSGEVSAKQLVRDSIEEYLQANDSEIFKPKDIAQHILDRYPQFNRGTVNCQIIADCVDHPSRHHYPGDQQDLWWRVRLGHYRRFNRDSDMREALDG